VKTIGAIVLALVVALAGLVLAARAGAFRLSLDELKARYERPESKYFGIGGLSIHYHDEGAGPAVLLVHGSFSTLRTWDPMVAALKDRYRLIRFDLPGFGLTGGDMMNPAARELSAAGIAYELLKSLGVEKVSCVGTSSGGTICNSFIAAHPEIAERLVISNAPSAPVNIPRAQRPPAVRVQMLLCDDILNFRTPWFWRTYYDYLWGEPARLTDDLLKKYYDFNRRAVEQIPRNLVPAGASNNAEAAMPQVRVPTLIIWGMDDPVLPPAMLDNLAAKMANAPKEIVRLERVGHYPILEVPDEFTRLADAFLSRPLAAAPAQ
jgi:pimeloyl-ACP methyl ester carboxylesterase